MENKNSPLIKVEGLEKHFGNSIKALDGIDIEIYPGEVTVCYRSFRQRKVHFFTLPQPFGRTDKG